MKRGDDDRDEHDPPDHGPSGPRSPGKSGQSHGEGVLPAFDGLSRRQGQAIEALLREPTISRAAMAARVYERTLRRWMTRPRFRAVWLAARREAFGQAVGLSQKYAPMAVATLVKVMNDAGAPANARVTAAALLLRFGRDGIELDDVVHRLEVLERSAWGGNGAVLPEGGSPGPQTKEP